MDKMKNNYEVRNLTFKLNELIKKGNINKVKEELLQISQASADPYKTAVKILEHSYDKKKRNSLCPVIVEILQNNFSEMHVTQAVKHTMFTITFDFQLYMLPKIIKTFKLDKPNLNLVHEFASKFENSKEYRKLAYIIQAFNLHSLYYTKEVYLPLLVNNGTCVVEAYIKDNEESQHYYLNLLDQWLLNGIDIFQFKVVSDVFLDKKKLLKLTSRWDESYNSDKKLKLVNLDVSKRFNNINFLLHRYYTENMISGSALEDLVLKMIDNDEVLLRKVSEAIEHQHNDRDRAMLLESKFQSQGESSFTTVWSDYEDDDINFLQLGYKQENVLMVDSIQKLVFIENEIFSSLSNKKTLGFDAEFTASATNSNENILALIQIASDEAVYLLDVCYFRSSNKMEKLEQLVTKIFTSSACTIFGYGAKSDFKVFRKDFKNFPNEPCNFIDLDSIKQSKTLSRYIAESNKPKSDNGVKVSGLSKLCLQILGQSLDKKEQISDWSRRPLREKQLTYAALDAACLLKIYHKLNESLVEIGQNFDEVWQKEMKVEPKDKKTKHKKEKVVKPNNPNKIGKETLSESTSKLSVRNFKIFCDKTVVRLGVMLRTIGVDVMEPKKSSSIEEICSEAVRDSRVILCTGKIYHSYVKACTKPNMCFEIDGLLEAKEQLASVVNFFNLVVLQEDLFSRCHYCNSDEYFIIRGETMKRLKKRHEVLKEKNNTESEDPTFGELVYSDFSGSLSGKKVDCNAVLCMKDLTFITGNFDTKPVKVNFDVPFHVHSRQSVFQICTKCGKIYWDGPHLKSSLVAYNHIITQS